MTQQEQIAATIDARIDKALETTGDVVELEPGEVPANWREIPFRILQLALTFGLVIPGYTCQDYLRYAVQKGGYETVEMWGVQGSGKSNRLLQMLYWVYQDWEVVLKQIVFLCDSSELPAYEDRGFIQRLKKVPHGKAIPALGWDDNTVDLPSSTFRTDVDKYGAVDSAWAAIRTKVNVMILTNPIINRLARNIKDNLTMEVFIGRNQVEMVERLFRLPGLDRLDSNFFKIQVEPLHKYDMFETPKDIFDEYWELRLALCDYAMDRLAKAYESQPDKEEWISVDEALEPLPNVSPQSLQRLASTGIVRTKKFEGLLFLKKEDYEKTIVPYYSKLKPHRRRED